MISDYYRGAAEQIRTGLAQTPDERAIGMDAEQWAAYFIVTYSMEPLTVDFGAWQMEEVVRNGHPAMLVTVPVEPSNTFDVIAKEGLVGGGAWLGFDYRTFFSNRRPYTLGQVANPEPNDINHAKGRMTQYVQSLNSSIEDENRRFPDRVRPLVSARIEAARVKEKRFDELSAAVGIPLKKRMSVDTAVPSSVRVKKSVQVLMPPEPKRQERLVLERDKFNAIMELIDNQCRAFERTPTVYNSMTEEALRDVILSALNAVFEGAAIGETFSGLGKADIHLRISQGEVFIAEIKIWDGEGALKETVAQLLERLTWRDSFGVVVIFSRNVNFGSVLKVVREALPRLDRSVAETFREEQPHHFVARFTLPSDASRQVEVHALVYNLFTERPSKRTGSKG